MPRITSSQLICVNKPHITSSQLICINKPHVTSSQLICVNLPHTHFPRSLPSLTPYLTAHLQGYKAQNHSSPVIRSLEQRLPQ